MVELAAPARASLLEVLEEARRRGFLGPTPVDEHLEQALAFAAAAERAAPEVWPAVASGGVPGRFLDLGSGGGIPGLVLALAWPASRGTLLDVSERRTDWLLEARGRLRLGDRVRVELAAAETAARQPEMRGRFQLVVARSFGPPAVVVECAAAFLADDGLLLVSEPPGGGPERWGTTSDLQAVGLRRDDRGPARIRVFRRVSPCPDRYPRRPGVPRRRPLFGS
ncbi:MAG: class I SAM-dependent methyltransferase [Acidimicrobiales bacterium]|jgi:16S rRNA (guanine527-N7)-methyltransferase|nr:class I SAM-dependent methyltransferase [Acidimicrobiales bacterium]